MKLLNTFFLSIIFFTSIFSQNLLKEVLNNDDITWVAETDIYFTLETEELEREYPSSVESSGTQKALEVIKISPYIFKKENVPYAYSDNALTQLIYKGIEDGHILTENREGEKLSIIETMAYCTQIDTFVSFHPETYEEQIEEAIYFDDDMFIGYVGKLLWYYDQKEKNIYSHLISYEIISSNDLKLEYSIVIPNKDENLDKHHFDDTNVLWSKATRIEKFDFSTAKILKGEIIPTFEEIFINNIKNKEYLSYRSERNIFSFEPNTDLEYENFMGMEMDTFVTFEPYAEEEVIEVSTRKIIDFETNLLTSFVHYWYWDEYSKTLSCELVSLAFTEKDKSYMPDFFKIKADNRSD